MTGSSLNLGRDLESKFMKLIGHQKKIKEFSSRHIIIKVSKIKGKERILKAARVKKLSTYKGTSIR